MKPENLQPTGKPLSSRAARRFAGLRGFTLTETMVVLAISPVILGAIVIATVSFQKTISASEKMIRAQAAQARVIDHVALDLRRAKKISRTVSVSSNPAANNNVSVKFRYVNGSAANQLKIRDGTYNPLTDRSQSLSGPSTYLTLTIPGYYQSNLKANAGYRLANPLTSTGKFIGYATSGSAFAPDVVIQYRNAYVPTYGSQCYIRRMMDVGVDEVIAEDANLLDLDIWALDTGAFRIDAWLVSTFSNQTGETRAKLASSDQVMLRNPRTD